MKKILKISSLAFLLFAGVSCENDNQSIATAKGNPELLTPVNGTAYVLVPENADNEATTLVWNHADYSVQTEVNYEIQVAQSGTDFANPISAGTTTNRFLTWTVEALNQAGLDAGLTPYTAGNLDLRIKASLGSNADLVTYSNVVKLTLTVYTTDLPRLYVVGNFLANADYGSDWSPASAVPLASSGFGKTDFEGYVYFNQASYEYKFLPTNADFGGDWGDNGDFAGILVQDGETNCLGSGQGYYRVKANTGVVSASNTDGLTYSLQPVTWGIIGSAVPVTEWNSDVDMTYNSTSKKWSIIITLQAGEIKFRYNDTWNVGDAQWNLGLFDVSKTGQNYGGENMSYGGGNIPVANAGTYLVELDLSNPRDYKFTMTAQ